jgi:serine acetyltransferase
MLGIEPFLVRIGNHVYISEGVDFHTHDGGVWIFRNNNPHIRVYGTITIEDNCIIGKNVQLLPNIRIGENSIVGAGSVVISDVPPNSIVMGVPARVISSVPKYEEKCLASWEKQKPPDLEIREFQEWWHSEENMKKLRSHLANLFAAQDKEEETEK